MKKPHAFIRIKDGALFVPHPTEEDRWVHKRMYEDYDQRGYGHWTTELFSQFVDEGTFDVAYTDKAAEFLSGCYRKLHDASTVEDEDPTNAHGS